MLVSYIGYTLDELNNQITKNTSACFWFSTLDYVVVKFPRWILTNLRGQILH